MTASEKLHQEFKKKAPSSQIISCANGNSIQYLNREEIALFNIQKGSSQHTKRKTRPAFGNQHSEPTRRVQLGEERCASRGQHSFLHLKECTIMRGSLIIFICCVHMLPFPQWAQVGIHEFSTFSVYHHNNIKLTLLWTSRICPKWWTSQMGSVPWTVALKFGPQQPEVNSQLLCQGSHPPPLSWNWGLKFFPLPGLCDLWKRAWLQQH